MCRSSGDPRRPREAGDPPEPQPSALSSHEAEPAGSASPSSPVTRRRTLVVVSDAARRPAEAPRGTSRLPSDLTDDQLAAAPVLASIDALVIEELSEDEDEAFAAALES